jgi:phosphorylcholine metabolism protein LicD
MKLIILLLILILIFILQLSYTNFTENFYNEIEMSPKLSEQDILDLKKGHKIITNMFREFDRICRKYNLKYWCVGGTLIGAIRHNGWVPWDGDVDVGMLEEDYNKLQKIIQKELPKNMWFQDKTTDKYYNSTIGKIRDLNTNYKDYKSQSWHNGLQLDIFIFKKDKDMLTISIKGTDIKNTNYNIIFPLKESIFENIKVYVPNNTKKYSIEYWGSYPPTLPPINKRFPHEGRIELMAPKWMLQKYKHLYKKQYKKIKYKNMDLYFPKNTQLGVNGNQLWVNWTGLTTKRPDILFKEINKIISIKKGFKILDIGCGNGEFCAEFFLKYKNNIDYIGTEIQPDLLNCNRLNFPLYKFYHIDNKNILKSKYDIILIMGYGHSLQETINTIINYGTKFIILESHIGKKPNFEQYSKIILKKYNNIYDKKLDTGSGIHLKRRLCIYELI